MADRVFYSVGSLFLGGRQVGILQNVEFSIDLSLQKLKGETLFAKAAAFSEAKVGVKIGTGQIDGTAIAGILGVTATVGSKAPQVFTTTIVASPVTYTPAPTGGATYAKDLGVKDATGTPMVKVASAPAVGQYSVNEGTGVYTFVTLQGKVTITAECASTTAGQTISMGNPLMGAAPTFEVRGYNAFGGSQIGHVVYACVIPKLSTAFKVGAFLEHKLEGEAIDNGSGQTIDLYVV